MQAILALEDGFVLHGQSFTGPGETSGEAIFNTGMTGYQEVLTDPSYAGQMVCMTYPLIGNYGINPQDMENDRVYVEGFIVKECCKTPSNWRSTESLPGYLKRHGVMGVEGMDTRALTRHLRLHGAKRGVISTEETDPAVLVARAAALPTMEGLGLADGVGRAVPYTWDGEKPVETTFETFAWSGKGPRLVVFDFGIKWNILRILRDKGFDILVAPARTSAEAVAALEPDAVFLSNGPGDPAALPEVIAQITPLSQRYPTAGICLGHQLLGHALGGKTFKLPFGHHGCNHPVQDVRDGHIEISSQNHGFCVDIDSLSEVRLTHVNLNDGTLEGFEHTRLPIMAIQHHPEACPGPRDCHGFFQRFRDMVARETGA